MSYKKQTLNYRTTDEAALIKPFSRRSTADKSFLPEPVSVCVCVCVCVRLPSLQDEKKEDKSQKKLKDFK